MRGNFKNIKNLSYIGAMQHPGGGKNDVPNRIKRQFFIFNMVLPSSVELIYGPILKHIFKPAKFSAEFNKVVDAITAGTVKLWNKVKNTLLPTPAKFHYVFNMRELSRIFKGLVGVRRDIVLSGSTLGFKPEIFLIALWRHESERVFVDKLTNNKEKDQVKNYIHEISLETFTQFESEILDKFKKETPIHFVDFLREDQVNEEGVVEVLAEQVYEGINNIEKLQARCYALLDNYNVKYSSKKMGLVLFDDAMCHLIRISRIIQQPRSSALLVGVGGSGK
jgi:dynein heavy chain